MKLIPGIAAAALIFMTGCTREAEVTEAKSIRITGSESEKPLVVYLSQEYAQKHTALPFDITGGGTNDGMSALIKGQTDIANASRIISGEELQAAKAAGIEVNQVIIAQDVISMITHPAVGVQYILLEDLTRIYKGEITNWKQLGGPDLEIQPVGRKSGSGTRSYMLHRLNLEEFCPETEEFATYEEIVTAVSTTPGAIGYVSNRFVSLDGKLNSSVWVMNISLNGMPYTSPLDRDDIAYGDYPLPRPLFQYYGTSNEPLRAFIEFELSEEGQNLVEKAGYVKLSDNQREINRRKAVGLHPDSLETIE